MIFYRSLFKLRGHSGRVGALAWNDHLLASGSRDTTVLTHDVRVQHHVVGTMKTHTQVSSTFSHCRENVFLTIPMKMHDTNRKCVGCRGPPMVPISHPAPMITHYAFTTTPPPSPAKAPFPATCCASIKQPSRCVVYAA